MQVSVYLLDAALNNDQLAQSQVSDILEDYNFKRFPQLKFEWIHEYRKSVCTALGITIYRSPRYYSVYLHTRRLNEEDSLEDAMEWVENYFSECFKNCYVRS